MLQRAPESGELQVAAEDHVEFVVAASSPRYEIQVSSGRVRYPRATG
jgi:hypothetical protein